MFDDLRSTESDNQSFQDALGLGDVQPVEPATQSRPRVARGLLGLTAPQRLVLSLLLLLAVCVLGTMCLLITGRISAF